MTVLTITNLTLRIAGRALLEGANLSVPPGAKIGLVGRNGAGKSTLLSAIEGRLDHDLGTIALSPRARSTSVSQEAPGGPTTPLDFVVQADRERTDLLAALDHAPPERLAELHDRLREIGADALPARAASILAGLGFDHSAQSRPLSSFSGGWRMRASLAAALALEPDLLLLDEPTNHLDLEAALWLETWLSRFPGAVVLVSHDRGLLDRAVGSIAHLDDRRITLYQGGYDSFVRQRTERAELDRKMAAKIGERAAHLQAFVDRFRAKASKARQAQSRLKALAKLPPMPVLADERETRFDIPSPVATAPPLLVADRASVGYAGRPILQNIELRIDPGDRIALLGRNGNGKSTLAKLLAGQLEPMAGELRRAPKFAAGFFAQDLAEVLDPDATPMIEMARVMPNALEGNLRSHLARFGLDVERAGTPVGQLSGGERARLVFALVTRNAPQLLILDEPTNHLDIDAREALARSLAEWPGAVVLVSHDEALVETMADRLLLVADGTVRPFDGDLDDYKALLAEQNREAARAEGGDRGPTRRDDRRARAEARAAQAPTRKAIADTEKQLAKLAQEKAKLETKLADPAIYDGRHVAAIAEAQAKLASISREQELLEERWLALSEALEA